MQISVHNKAGQIIDYIEVGDDVFGITPNEAVVHQALTRQLANARQGTADTKTRGEVAGSTRKLYAQKHTGRARQGSIRAPHRRKGGIVFGPHPRSYSQRMPKKMRRLAIRSILSAKVAQGELVVVDNLELEEPKTKEMRRILDALGISSSAMVVTAEPDANLVKSACNLEGIKTLPAPLLNVVDLLSHKALVMTVAAVRKVEELWGTSEAPVIKTRTP